jgi:hypothetical protein
MKESTAKMSSSIINALRHEIFTAAQTLEVTYPGVTVALMVKLFPPSKNSEIATSGNNAETLMTKDARVSDRLADWFEMNPYKIEKAPARKKTDLVLTLELDTKLYTFNLQNKNGENTQGFSVDRRWLADLPVSPNLGAAIQAVCLDHVPFEGTLECPATQSSMLCLLRTVIEGGEYEWIPDYFTHTTTKDDKIDSLYIVSRNKLLEFLGSSLYTAPRIAKTCIHLSPHLYLQRKGGDYGKESANQIQTKLKLTHSVLAQFHRLC